MVSIIISWRNRKELGVTLNHFIEVAKAFGGEVIVVNFGGNATTLGDLLCESDFLRVIDVREREFFNKPTSQNLGAAAAIHPVLFFCDCDIVLTSRVMEELIAGLEHTANSFVTIAGVRETVENARGANNLTCFGYTLHLRTRDGREVYIDDHEEDAETGERNAPGLLMVRRTDFLAVGGYNSQLDGWGWEDQDMICRLTLHGGLTRVNAGHVVHVSHPDHERISGYPYMDRWSSRDKMFRLALANYDNAKFLGSFQQDSTS